MIIYLCDGCEIWKRMIVSSKEEQDKLTAAALDATGGQFFWATADELIEANGGAIDDELAEWMVEISD